MIFAHKPKRSLGGFRKPFHRAPRNKMQKTAVALLQRLGNYPTIKHPYSAQPLRQFSGEAPPPFGYLVSLKVISLVVPSGVTVMPLDRVTGVMLPV